MIDKRNKKVYKSTQVEQMLAVHVSEKQENVGTLHFFRLQFLFNLVTHCA